jgi:hypothetical protein
MAARIDWQMVVDLHHHVLQAVQCISHKIAVNAHRCSSTVLCTWQADSVDLWRGVDWAFVDRIVAHKV